MCISCCTNIVQCSACNKARVEAVVSMNNWLQASSPSALYGSVYPTNIGLCASESSKKKKVEKKWLPFVHDCKRDLSENPEDWEKGIQTFLWRFSPPPPPPLPCGDFWQRMNRQSILSLQLLSIFRDKQQSAREASLALPCSESQVCLLHPVFPVSDKCLFSTECGQKRKANMVEVTKALTKKTKHKTRE